MSNFLPSLLCTSLLFSVACTSDKSVEEEQIDTAGETTNVGIPSDSDLDGDGIANEDDNDADGDGVPSTEDCDDTNAEVLASADDMDCDGILNAEDIDQDGDGIDAASDCDDGNPESTSIEEDADCDGILTVEDCDDTDANMGYFLYDVDCDGYVSYEDCDDRDPNSTLTENDTDCDGILNEEDLFPEDAAESVDSDGDGIGDNNDQCEGGDDSIDEDGNGVPDHCDDPGWLNCSSDRPMGTADYQIHGQVSGERAGSIVSFAGDVDGDGLEDILLSTNPIYTMSDMENTIYLFLGSSIAQGVDLDTSNADYEFTSSNDTSYFAENAIGIGDYDGDGLDDLLISESDYDYNHGRVYLILGSSLGADYSIDVSEADTHFYTLDDAVLGTSIAAMGDINGDGLADIAFSQWAKTFVFFGSSTIQVERHVESADFTAAKIPTTQSYAFEVGAAGDVDGDGLDDLIIGAHQHQNNGSGSNVGRAYLVLGSTIINQTYMTVDQADYQFMSYSDEYLGQQVASAGDVDADGLDDIIIGAPSSDFKGQNTGAVYIMLGSTINNSSSNILEVNEADYRLYGDILNEMLGYYANTVGDYDGDGHSDFALTALYSSYSGFSSGVVYLFSGASLPYLATANEIYSDVATFKLTGGPGITYVGHISPRTADFDGDNLDDILVGSGEANSQTGLVNIFTTCSQ